MTDEGEDVTDEVREAAGEEDAIGGSVDDDSGAILTLDGPDTPSGSGGLATDESDGDDE